MRKTTMYFRPVDDERIEEIKKAKKLDEQTDAVRYALHNCDLTNPSPKKK